MNRREEKRKIDLLAPAGSFDSLQAAVKAGADAVYFGFGKLNMRSRSSNNFSLEDLDRVVKECREKNVKSYVTLNTVMYDDDLTLMKEMCDEMKKANVDAVIASDMAVIAYARSIGLNVHLSTQANVSNIEAASFYSRFVDLVVLARELRLQQIQEISRAIEKRNICGPSGRLLKVEAFVHGALCVAISGKCYMSLAQHNLSANRGECLQVCRRKYRVIEEESGSELLIDNQYVMSPKDLCTIDVLDQIVGAGVSVLKIEGRGRSPEYVYTVVSSYREALDAIAQGTYSKEKVEKWSSDLRSVYNRGFWQGGYYLGNKLGEWSGAYGSVATKKKIYVGKVSNYFDKIGVGEFLLEAHTLKKGDAIVITGPSTGVVKGFVESLRTHEKTSSAGKGETATIPVSQKIRRNDKLYVLVDR